MKRGLALLLLCAPAVLPTAAVDAYPGAPDAVVVPRPERADGADAAAWVRSGDALMHAARESLDPADHRAAEEAYRRALALEPDNARALVGLAWVHNAEHEFDAGRRFAVAALTVDPQLPEAHALLGDAAVELGEYDTAFRHYQQALDLHPDLSSYSRAAHLLWLTGDSVTARWLMQKAIDAGAPHSESTAWCRARLAEMLFEAGALVVAEQTVAQALLESPDNPYVLAVAGRLKTARKDYPAAIELYRRSVAAAPTHEALATLVDLYTLTGQHDEANAQFDRVVTHHSSHRETSDANATARHSHPSYELARFYAANDRRVDEALNEARAAWKAFPNVTAADTLAWCLYKNGALEAAAEMIERALAWRTPLAEIHYHAGMIYAALGRRALAQKHLYAALSLNPHFHPIDNQRAAQKLRELSGQPSRDRPIRP